MQGKIYLKNAVLLTVSGFALRILGMAFRVYLAAQLGGEGMGLYQLILAIYMVFVSLATSGINVASANLAAKSLARGKTMAKTASGLICTAAAFGTVAMCVQFLLAGPAARYAIHDVRAELALRVLAPSLPFMAMAGALRGCFLAKRRVQPNVTAQMVEQLIRMTVVFLALKKFAPWGAEYACGAVLLGNTISETLSCGIMFLYAKKEPAFHPQGTDYGRKYSSHELWNMVIPVEGSRVLGSLLQAAESTLIPLCLAVYLGKRTLAVAQYGTLKGMALPLLFFPFSVLAALSGLLMPEITRAWTQNNRARTVKLITTMMELTGLFSALAGGVFFLLGAPAAQILYGSQEAGEYIRILAATAPFMYMESMVDGVLKGLGEQWATFRFSVEDSAMRIAGIVFLLPRYGMNGFLFVMILSNLFTCTMNTRQMLRRVEMKMAWWPWLCRPVLFAVIGAAAAFGVREIVPLFGLASAFAGGGVLCAVYCTLSFLFGNLQKNPSLRSLLHKKGEKE
jgi:stage V sporulation protein B